MHQATRDSKDKEGVDFLSIVARCLRNERLKLANSIITIGIRVTKPSVLKLQLPRGNYLYNKFNLVARTCRVTSDH